MLHGQLKNVHPSAQAKDMIIEGSKWFSVDYGYASSMMKDIYKNYKQSLIKSRKQPQYIKDNFTLDRMTEKFEGILNNYLPNEPFEGEGITNGMIPGVDEFVTKELQTYE